jgi:hypothetical protein
MKASLIIKKATEWLGYNEADGSHKQIIDIYNSRRPLPRGYKVKYTDSWCATFVSAVAISLNAEDIIPRECSCEQMVKLAQYYDIWVEEDSHIPCVGDIILYDWDDKGNGDDKGWSDHIGYVVSVNNGQIKVIEGNLNNSVAYREIAVNGRFIRGYICPKYEAESVEEKTNTITLAEVVKKVVNGDYGNGEERKRRIPTETPFTYEEVRVAVNAYMSADKYPADIPAIEYYPKYSGKSNSLVDALKSLKIDSSFNHRKQIAKANAIHTYIGTASQNTKLLNLLKDGKLIKE